MPLLRKRVLLTAQNHSAARAVSITKIGARSQIPNEAVLATRIVEKPGKQSELLEYLRWDAEMAKAREPGAWRFDVWEAEREPGVVYLYEAYKDRAAFEDRAKHDPYRKWSEIADKTMEQVPDVIPLTESLASNVDE